MGSEPPSFTRTMGLGHWLARHPPSTDGLADGATDYIIFPLLFLDTTRSAALSFATRVPAGFSEADLADLEQAAAIFSPYVERYVLRRVAIDLLETYVGPRSAERIFAGRFVRGQIETITAAICMADLRGFTRLADSAPLEKVIAALDDWFECLALAVDAHDGEILKFMGDGLLAIYAVDGSPEEACERALAAALKTLSALHALNIRRAAAGEDRLACGFGLHLGEVA
jgi:adenylate cyclase